MSLPVGKLSFVIIPIEPIILAHTIGHISLKGACVRLPVGESAGASALFCKIVKLSLVSLIFVDQNPKALDHISTPLPKIGYSFWAFPNPTAILPPSFPFAVVGLAVIPEKLPPSFTLPLVEVSHVKRSIRVLFEASPLLLILRKMALEELAVGVKDYAQPFFSHCVGILLAHIDALFVSFHAELQVLKSALKGLEMRLVFLLDPLHGDSIWQMLLMI